MLLTVLRLFHYRKQLKGSFLQKKKLCDHLWWLIRISGSHQYTVWKSKSLSHVQLFAAPWTIQSMEFSIRILAWVAVPFSEGSSQPRDLTQVSRMVGRFFTSWATREAHCITGTKHWFRKLCVLGGLIVRQVPLVCCSLRHQAGNTVVLKPCGIYIHFSGFKINRMLVCVCMHTRMCVWPW